MLGGIVDRIMGRDGQAAEGSRATHAAEGVPTGVVTLGNANFTKAIRQHPLTVVDFWAPWCSPCRAISPIVEQLSKSYAGRVAFGKVNVDKERWVASSLRIRSIPTIVLFSRGRAVDRVVGAVPKSVIDAKIRQRLGGDRR